MILRLLIRSSSRINRLQKEFECFLLNNDFWRATTNHQSLDLIWTTNSIYFVAHYGSDSGTSKVSVQRSLYNFSWRFGSIKNNVQGRKYFKTGIISSNKFVFDSVFPTCDCFFLKWRKNNSITALACCCHLNADFLYSFLDFLPKVCSKRSTKFLLRNPEESLNRKKGMAKPSRSEKLIFIIFIFQYFLYISYEKKGFYVIW